MASKSRQVANQARISVVKMTSNAKAAHTGSSLSLIDILSVLYCEIAVINTGAKLQTQDTVLVSKGHAAAGTYAVMAHAGLIPLEILDTYCKDGSILGGHVTKNEGLPVEFSTGSLGHALPYGVGVALSNKLDNLDCRTFVVLSDGECDEGSNWEAALLSAHLHLSNLVVLIDRNRLQSLGGTEDTVRLEPLDQKWSAFGWNVIRADGHDHHELKSAIESALEQTERPTVVICETVKGYGVSFMENSVVWHYRPPLGEDLSKALSELDFFE